jgi:hypothetical protein
MYTFSVSSSPGPTSQCFQVRPPVVAFAGSRRGSLPRSVSSSLVHAFHALDLSLLTGCAPGIDGCFRRAMAHKPFEEHSMVACAFESRTRRIGTEGLLGIAVVPEGLSPAAALHRRTVWMVRRCGLLVVFPTDPVFARWGRGSTLAFRAAVYNLKPVFCASPTAPRPSPLYKIYPASLFGIVSGFWVVPHPIYQGGPCDEE